MYNDHVAIVAQHFYALIMTSCVHYHIILERDRVDLVRLFNERISKNNFSADHLPVCFNDSISMLESRIIRICSTLVVWYVRIDSIC